MAAGVARGTKLCSLPEESLGAVPPHRGGARAHYTETTPKLHRLKQLYVSRWGSFLRRSVALHGVPLNYNYKYIFILIDEFILLRFLAAAGRS